MKRASKLSILFRDELQNIQKESAETSEIVETKPSDSSSNNANNRLLSSWSSSSFQIPLHYPNYTKEDYKVMSEEELDRLLKLYGLPINVGDLTFKREFVAGAFLWEKELIDSVNPNSSSGDLDERSFMGLIKDVFHFILRAQQVNKVKP